MADHTVRISKEGQAEINRMAKLSGQSAKEYLDKVLGMGKYPDKWSEWAKANKIDESQVDDVLGIRQSKIAKPPTTIIDAMILDLWRLESLKHWEENPVDHSRLSITSKLKLKRTSRTRQHIIDYVGSNMSHPSPFLKDTGISWSGLFKQYFESDNFKKVIDNRLKKLAHQNFLYKPTRGIYELELTDITERQWQLIHALTILPPSRQSSRKPRYGYQIPPLIDILVL
tara:strand:+ start:432 stop:1115 length:684 start_codon:yes stop_codon:yes gene_type:complete